jgi:hypothetical protein
MHCNLVSHWWRHHTSGVGVLHVQARVLLNPGDPVLLEEFTYPHHVDAHLLQMG